MELLQSLMVKLLIIKLPTRLKGHYNDVSATYYFCIISLYKSKKYVTLKDDLQANIQSLLIVAICKVCLKCLEITCSPDRN